MATQRICNPQGADEVRTYYIDFTLDLPEGVTVESATATHTPPSGEAASIVTSVETPNVSVTVPALGLIGVHLVSCLAELSNNDISEVLLVIPVKW